MLARDGVQGPKVALVEFDEVCNRSVDVGWQHDVPERLPPGPVVEHLGNQCFEVSANLFSYLCGHPPPSVVVRIVDRRNHRGEWAFTLGHRYLYRGRTNFDRLVT